MITQMMGQELAYQVYQYIGKLPMKKSYIMLACRKLS
jgi:hypothetical protein